MEITDKWLMEMGGWQAMKAARALWQAGSVTSVSFDGSVLQGTVRGSGKELFAGLTIKGRSDLENRCTCYMARRDGRICEHSLALGVAWVNRHEKAPASASSSSPVSGQVKSSALPVQPAAAKGPLSFTFAGNFMEGLRRGRLAATVDSGPPDAVAQAADTPFLTWLGTLQQKTVPPHLMLSARKQMSDFLAAVTAHPRLFLQAGGKKLPLRIAEEPAPLFLTIKAGAGDTVRLSLRFPDAKQEAAVPPSPGESGWLWQPAEAHLQPMRVPAAAHELLSTLAGRPLEKSRRWLAQMLADLQEAFTVDTENTDPELLRLHMVPAVPGFELHLEGSLERLTAKLLCVYENGPPPFPPGVEVVSGFPLATPDSKDVFLTRNLPAEAAAFQRLERCGFELSEGDLVLKKENAILQFFAGELERLQKEWKVTLGTRFTAATAKVERLTPQWTPVGSGQDWLAFDMRFASGSGTSVDRMEIARMLATGSGHKKLPNGKLAVLSLGDAADLNEVLRDVRPDQATGAFRVKRAQLAYLEQSFGKPIEGTAAPAWPVEETVPEDLRKILRDYQKTGVQWLLDHAARGFGGILADEMGLGKTLQGLAMITALRKKWPERPALIVCPKSLLGNWQAEARHFAAGMRVLCLHGSGREERFAETSRADIVLTSYQLLARDIAHHAAAEWGGVILDEAGFIRNPDTQAAKAARSLKAGVKIALTGTPIENGVRDLWSIMEFALSGYLGSRDDFRERYEVPLTSGGSPQLMTRLRRRMAPYILRRLKQDVAKDLPSKIEIIHSCELSPVQRDLYSGLLREGAAKVIDAENAKQKGQARLHMLTALLRLRQTCCDPRLLPADQPRTGDAALSGKMEALSELLDEIKEGGHSVIIFSAFASMLKLIETTVQEAELGYCYLDGQTRDRSAQVTAFQTDTDKRVFLISLKAGGYGLNLTKADTVVHFDPWWNPAVEAQATDRAHRIGQSRPVSVYKLITTGTVEEKILKLQQKKRGLMDSALDDAAPLMEGLTDEDLRSLVME